MLKISRIYWRHLFRVSVAEVLHETWSPDFVTPIAPAGAQNAPAVTSFITSPEGEGVEVGVASGVGVGELEITGSGVSDATGFAAGTPLFQTNFPLLFTQVYLIPLTTLEEATGLQTEPAFTAATAFELGIISPKTRIKISPVFLTLNTCSL